MLSQSLSKLFFSLKSEPCFEITPSEHGLWGVLYMAGTVAVRWTNMESGAYVLGRVYRAEGKRSCVTPAKVKEPVLANISIVNHENIPQKRNHCEAVIKMKAVSGGHIK